MVVSADDSVGKVTPLAQVPTRVITGVGFNSCHVSKMDWANLLPKTFTVR